MEYKEELFSKLKKYKIGNNVFQYKSIPICSISFQQVREIIWRFACIDECSEEDGEFLISIKSGTARMNTVTAIIKYDSDNLHVAVCSKEGIFKQKSCEKAIGMIVDSFKG